MSFTGGLAWSTPLPAEDPVLENVLKWTVERDAKMSAGSLNGFRKPDRVVNGKRC